MRIKYQYVAYPTSKRATILSDNAARTSITFGMISFIATLASTIWYIASIVNMCLNKGIKYFFISLLFLTITFSFSAFFAEIYPIITSFRCEKIIINETKDLSKIEKQKLIEEKKSSNMCILKESIGHVYVVYSIVLVMITILVSIITGYYLIGSHNSTPIAIVLTILGTIVFIAIVILLVVLRHNYVI